MNFALRESFRSLLLPIPIDAEEDALGAVEKALEDNRVVECDRAYWLRQHQDTWRETGTPDRSFMKIVKSAIQAGGGDHNDALSTKYFELHSTLMTEFLFSHEDASAFLSHAQLICQFSAKEKMSSAQIAKVLEARDSRVGFSRQSVDKIVSKLGTKRDFSVGDLEHVFNEDASLEEALLADADLKTAAESVGRVASALGVRIDISRQLATLADSENLERYSPYLQMLHYQCTIAEFFDHPVTDIYEFSPRGRRVDWLVEQYPDTLVEAANPFLNNAKSVERANLGWARSKKLQQYPGATALVEILSELEDLGFAARQELAAWIRLWLHRVMRFAQPIAVQAPERLTVKQIGVLLNVIAAHESNTSGIIEQRIVDALSSVEYPQEHGWYARGLGDAVNASNVSRQKIGDCDYQNIKSLKAIAFEAHGGALTETYLGGHIQTLPKALQPRLDEWANFSSIEDWNIRIHFVAHDIQADKPDPIVIEGANINFVIETYADMFARHDPHQLSDAIHRYLLTPLHEKRTPSHTRQWLLDNMGGD